MIKNTSKKTGYGSNHSYDPLNQYMKEINKINLLSREEEITLARSIKQGNSKAIQEMVRRNLKYVVTVAKKYQGYGLSLQDLIEEGNIGLIQAAKRLSLIHISEPTRPY